jgi:hypothetical protein
MINPETGEKYSTASPGKAINPETGEEYTPVAPTAASIISNSPAVKASQSAVAATPGTPAAGVAFNQGAPAKAINPETGEEYTPVAPVQTAAAPQKKYGGYGQATAESVSYRDDQALARIVQLSRR